MNAWDVCVERNATRVMDGNSERETKLLADFRP